MDWIERLNETLLYIEANLDGEFSYEKAAQLAACSTYHFQRMFTYIAGIPLGEYIRRRRLTKAALLLLQGWKVLDVALLYGYDSPTSFTRAFQTIHGLTPSQAKRQGATLKAYPKISFSLTIKGGQEMEYRIESKDGFKVAGATLDLMMKDVEQNMRDIPRFWTQKYEDGTIARLCSMLKPGQGLLGLCTNSDATTSWTYMIGVEMEGKVPLDLEVMEVPPALWAIFPGRGAMPRAIQEVERRIVTDWLPTSGYEFTDGMDIEVYLSEDPNDQSFEVWMPIKKARA